MAISGHNFESGSGLQDWIEHELSHLAAQDQDKQAEALGDRNLSLRAPLAVHLMLARIAEKISRSKSAVSEEVLSHAVRDVYTQFGLPRVTREDVAAFAAQNDKTGDKTG